VASFSRSATSLTTTRDRTVAFDDIERDAERRREALGREDLGFRSIEQDFAIFQKYDSVDLGIMSSR